MAFITSSVSAIRPANLAATKRCALSGASVSHRVASSRRVAPVRMSTYWEGEYPPSEILGLGKDVPSSLFVFSSAIALLLGCYCVYQSNLINPLSSESVNPQFIVGSLLVPISWGLHVAGWIQGKNNK
ncbi:hypothetical protein BWQ96_04496 [Gracilariopsis chorda]|uniref:Uncharacterized protein n=1 Tax=Gracilariopsis chorda TaxID=448386 RepID=A0A2V3IUA9_9FLOR|nr:hypothetical protein BWQ96_04496 [Gracilariopsis chorda]|eukprot:PXF45728.1 hypothetical protein BWQ96_04496 [Gracilariopsis chorda]